MSDEDSIRHFSGEFDVLYNNIASDTAPGLTEYEKSVFLTKAQNELVKNYFDPQSKGNALGRGFDESAVRQMDFSNLLVSSIPDLQESSEVLVDPRELVYAFPSNPEPYIIINEQMFLSNDDGKISQRQVVPLSFQEYMRLMSKPFKEPLKWQAWRLNVTKTEVVDKKEVTSNKISIVLNTPDSKYANKQYFVRYVRKPVPIILEGLDDEYRIEGEANVSACELNEGTWDAIIQRAVELAKITWNGNSDDTQLMMTSGQRSE